MSIFYKQIQTTILYLSLYMKIVIIILLNYLLPHISMQKIDNKVEVSSFTHGPHEDIT
jgi:hypothetical protein